MDIFLCDDSRLIRERLHDQLTQIPEMKVIGQAGTVYESIELMKRIRPDVAVVDFRFPDGTGLEILEFIKNVIPSTIVIILTNYPFAQYRQKCLALGADFFLDKSSEFDRVPQICIDSFESMKNTPNKKLKENETQKTYSVSELRLKRE